MSTTVGTSRGLDMLGNHLFTQLFERARDRRPRVAALDEPAPGVSELAAALRIAQERDDLAGKGSGLVGADVMAAGTDSKPFGADCRRHDRPRHAERFENLQPRSAA